MFLKLLLPTTPTAYILTGEMDELKHTPIILPDVPIENVLFVLYTFILELYTEPVTNVDSK